MHIGIIGNGIVGNATGKAFEPHVDEVRYWDVIDAKCTHSLHDTVCGTDLVMICLPTPQCKDSLACDISTVDDFFCMMAELRPTQNYVLRSTVPVGFTRMLREKYGLTNLVHSPEFLTARTAEEDAKNPTRMIIGHPLMNEPHDCRCEALLGDLYVKAFNGRNIKCGPSLLRSQQGHCQPTIHHMTSDESEFVKLMQNAFSAIKIAAFNEFRSFSDAKGMDWERCLAALLAGGWINKMHTQVPGPDGKRGFGGSCLPKDLANLVQCMYDIGVVPPRDSICQAALDRNRHLDRKE